jgi:PII-like signaling protein
VTDGAKLTVHFGEADRVGRRLLSDELLDLFERHRVHASALLRAAEGFGLKQTLRTDRLLTLSEDLPLVAVAVDRPARIEALVPEARALVGDGLVTLERLTRGGTPDAAGAKLTVYLGRREAPAAVVDRLRAAGVAGATVLLGVDGTMHGRRRRARFLSHNAGVPALVVAVGDGARIAAGIDSLRGLLVDPVLTLERVRVCKRDGVLLARPDPAPPGTWRRLTVYGGEDAQHGGRPLFPQLLRRLREAGASGATTLRGVRGFSGEHAPHGDRLLSPRRRVPLVTVAVDTAGRLETWFDAVDELTAEHGLVTVETVPRLRATAGATALGEL